MKSDVRSLSLLEARVEMTGDLEEKHYCPRGKFMLLAVL